MREIKFRAWDRDDAKMSEIGDRLMNFRGYEIMQFTGLKDKNGKEIYAHDFVAFEIETEFGRMRVMGEVVYHIAAWCVRVLNNYDKAKPYFEFEILNVMIEALHGENPFEVIGNIYEKPSLLQDIRSATS